MSEQKTILLTSIYSHLWGTEFGGRPSREHHYKFSLLNILNLKPNKIICFTSQDELNDLENFFFTHNNIDKSLLEFRVFDLKESKHFEKIFSKKNLEAMKTFDRCFEIQYNKFFWSDDMVELYNYDKVYWFDAGLSHGGLFPEKFAYGSGYERNFKFSIFNENFLRKLNLLTDTKFVLVTKNNSGAYYWSTTIPENYYLNFEKDVHVVGGFFGGTPHMYFEISKRFDLLLNLLLENETELYMEEQILSCLYYNNKEKFILLQFDDWYKKPFHNDKTTLFYHLFLDEQQIDEDKKNIITIQEIIEEQSVDKKSLNEILNIQKNKSICVTAICINENNHSGKNYVEHAKNMIRTYLEFTDFEIVLLTDKVNSFSEFDTERLKLINYDEYYSEQKKCGNFFNYHLKRFSIEIAKKMNYDIIYYVDCDCYIIGWDNDSFLKKCSEEFDVAFVKHAHPQLGDLRKTYKHFQDKLDDEYEGIYFEELDLAPNPAETHVLFKNNDKLNLFLEFWDKVSANNKRNSPTYHDGVYFGTSAIYAKMKMVGIDVDSKFIEYSRISHGDKTLNFFGYTI